MSMSKKKLKKRSAVNHIPTTQPAVVAPSAFGYEDMLAELEAIVTDAEVRLTGEDVIPDSTALSQAL